MNNKWIKYKYKWMKWMRWENNKIKYEEITDDKNVEKHPIK